MKLHKNLLKGLHNAFAEVLQQDKYADKVLERTLKTNKKWGAKDRAYISEIFYEIIRWKRQYEFYIGKELNENTIYEIILAYLLKNKMEFQLFDEFHGISVKKLKDNLKKTTSDKAIQYSVPNWLLQRFQKELPQRWEQELKALNIPAETILRVNTLKTSKDELIEKLAEERIETVTIKGYNDALKLTFKKNVFKTQAFKEGLFEIQDASSQLVAEALDAKAGMKIIDACAGAGGKTLHIASKMQNKGNIVALDIFEWKLIELKRRAKRAGVFNITTKVIDDNKVLKRLYNSADAVLIDAPCSGTGVLRRNPDAKWKLNEDFINRMVVLQAELLQSSAKMVKNGGTLVYATCSILPSENREQIDKFLSQNNEFQLISMQEYFPSECKFDGFFIAKLKKIA